MTIKLNSLVFPVHAAGVLTLPLAACSKTESASGNSFLSAMGVTTSVPQAAVQSVAVVETVPEPVVEVPAPPPVCEPYNWRYMIFDCHGVQIGTYE